MTDDFVDKNKRPHHLHVVDTKQDLEKQIRQLLTGSLSGDDEQATLERMDAESQNFERITGIQAWGPPLKDLARLIISVPFHHSKIAKLYKSKELYHDIRRKRLDLNDANYLGWFGGGVLTLGIVFVSLGVIYPDKTRNLANLVASLIITLTGTGLVMFSAKIILEPWSWCRRLRPYVDSLYAEKEEA